MFIFRSYKLMSLAWLVTRLKSEDTADNPERWKAVIESLERLLIVDESTTNLDHVLDGSCSKDQGQAAQNSRLQSVSGTSEQNQIRGRASPNTAKGPSRRDVATLRETFSEGEVVSKGEARLVAIAAALLDRVCILTDRERKLVRLAPKVDESVVSEVSPENSRRRRRLR
jgi:hypothetical protein